MTIAKQGLLLTEMIDQGMIHAVVATGALMCHGLIEQTGGTHFRYDPTWDDDRLYEAGYCRVYDTLELERNLRPIFVGSRLQCRYRPCHGQNSLRRPK